MTLHHFIRRLHLCLALALLPWFFMYALSAIPFSHHQFFDARERATGRALWATRFERPYEIDIPTDGDLRPVGARIMADTGLKGAFGIDRPNRNQITVYVDTLFTFTRLKYFIDEKKLVAEVRAVGVRRVLTGMHEKSGFKQGGLHDIWGVVVDLVCVGMALWVATGLFMWWKLPPARGWGWLALAGGVGAFAMFVLKL